MPTPKKGARLGGSPAHQKLIIANLATSLFEHGRITTTEAKARVLRPVAERLITKAKKGDLHNRRQVLSTIRDKGVVHNLFEEIGPRYAERPGGYTRITKLGPRKGDNAPMAVIELVTEEYVAKARTGRPTKTGAAPSQPAASSEGAPAEETQAGESQAGEAPASAAGDAVQAEQAGEAQTDADEPAADEPAADEPAAAEEETSGGADNK